MELLMTTEINNELNYNLTDVSSTFPSISSTDAAYRVVGSRRDPLYIVIPITIIYLIIFIAGIIGNVSTCIVIARIKSMHTATNYYLFSLAVSDLLLLISGLPAEVYLVWSKYPYIFGEGFCVVRGLAAECSTNASVLTIAAFTVERYIAICHPFLSHTMSKLSRVVKLILVIWLVAMSFAIPQALQFGVIEYPNISPDVVICTRKSPFIKHSFEIATLLFFIIPMTLITVLYSMIGLKLRKSNMMKKRNIRNQGTRSLQESKKKKWDTRNTGKSSRRVLKMLVAVVVAFFICWAPFHVQRLIAIYGTDTDQVTSKNKWMTFLYNVFTYLSGVLYYVSTTINPILYNIMSNKFREAFKETLAKSCGGSRSSSNLEQRSYSSLSRSQQRTLGGGNFGSRTTAGTGIGTGVGQDSSEGSGNSIRDENNLRHQTVSPVDSKHSDIIRVNSSSSQRKIDNPNNDNYLNKKNSKKYCDQLETGNAESTLIIDSDCPRQGNININNGTNEINKKNSDRNSNTRLINGDVCHQQRLADANDDYLIGKRQELDNNKSKYFGLKASNDKKLWRFLKWLPTGGVFKFAKSSTRNCESVVSDIESNREEYSMTTCYVAGEHRLV
ncbi:pyrokinin-1 receptor [Microplitis demolitor]|uniref:pyrokinin-1 receptor n=1 Tax=Microplitis demolitor TaxID=69319 RepID=UPI00043FFF31|nr:pyrokinin-1 receptor [Microplitis demolitor]